VDQLIFAAVLALLILTLGAATWYSGRLLRRLIPPVNLLLTLPDTLLRLVLILVCIALGLWLGPGVGALGWRTDRLVQDALIGAAAAVLLAPGFMWVGYVVVRRWGPEIYDNRLLRAIVPVNRGEWFGVVLALAPAAVLEELLFRSLPLGGLTWLASPWVLMWPFSLLFGLMHASQGQWGLVGTALMGLLLSALFLYTGSIWAPIVAHWLLNVTEVTLAQRQGLRPLRADTHL
jgi:membrane protease YdiL (CAAX protease family)